VSGDREHRPLVVMKFGGSSVANPDRMKNVARRIIDKKREGNRCVVVVSAMGDTTDDLIDLSKKINADPPDREMDLLMSAGEQISSALLAMAIQAEGEKAAAFFAPQLGIRTDSVHTKARIVEIDGTRLQKEITNGNIAVCAGFQGLDASNDITTLGRGGSDTTAVALAVALKADVCEVYTDVDGIYTADPRVVPEARKIERIYFDEMLELASLGAKVMMNRSIEFAKKYNIPLHVRSSLNGNAGSWIIEEEETPMMERPIVRAVAADKDQARITAIDLPDVPGVAAKLFGGLAESNINVDMIVQSSSEHEIGKNDIAFTVASTDLKRAVERLKPVLKDLSGGSIVFSDDVAKVSIVGVGMRSHAGVAAKMFKSLAAAGVNIEMISTSEIKVSCIISRSKADEAVRRLHAAFELGRQAPVAAGA